MEHQTRFDLEPAIANWRSQLAATESISDSEARELEAHLRDAIAAWTAKGLTAEEAFSIAGRRLGPPAKIADEFAKEDPRILWQTRLFWMFLGVVTMNVLEAGSRTFFTVSMLMADHFSRDPDFDIRSNASSIYNVAQIIGLLGAPVLLYVLSQRFVAGSFAKCVSWAGKTFSSRLRLAIAFSVILAAANVVPILAQQILSGVFNSRVTFGGYTLMTYLAFLIYPALIGILAAWFAPIQRARN